MLVMNLFMIKKEYQNREKILRHVVEKKFHTKR